MNHPNTRGVRRDRIRTSLVRRASAPRRRRRALAALGTTAIGALLVGVFLGAPAAYAVDYPSWADVQAAKSNEATAAAEVTRIQGLITSLTQNVADTKAAAETAGNEYFAAQQALNTQALRLKDLQSQAAAQKKLADESASKAGQVAAKLSRTGGDTAALQLFFSKSTANTDELLQRLGRMDRALAGTQAIYDKALVAKNTAQSLTDQAATAKTERDRLAKVMEAKMQEAQAAADAAAVALTNQETYLGQLQAQLAALRDTTAKTVAQYQAGEAARAAALAAQRAAEAAARQSAGGGGGGGGWASSSNGWSRPFGGYVSSGFGPRVGDCNSSGCASSNHMGVDFADGGCGSPIYASHSGTVVYAGRFSGYGNYIKIANGDGSGLATGYGHIVNGGYNVSRGQWVEAGQVIAYQGDTGVTFGCNLHFELYAPGGGQINPTTYLERQGVDMS